MSLQSRFEQAVAESKQLEAKPDNLTLLRLYALYKQATQGDAAGERPGISDLVGRAKWDAWQALQGKDRDAAREDYIALVESLQ